MTAEQMSRVNTSKWLPLFTLRSVEGTPHLAQAMGGEPYHDLEKSDTLRSPTPHKNCAPSWGANT